MKKFCLILLTSFLLLISACNNVGEEESVQAKEENTDDEIIESDTELDDLEKENEELKKEIAKKENEELKKELDENSSDNENSDEVKNKTNNSESSEGDRSALKFDINSTEVQTQLNTTRDLPSKNFEQDAIKIGMSQSEVEEIYGKYDFTFYYQGSAPAFYENLAVIYSELGAYGDGSDGSIKEINPDKNMVQAIYYFANASEKDLYDAFGKPTEYIDGSKSMNGLPYYIYEGETDSGKYYITGVSTFESPSGEIIGLISRDVYDENPNDQYDDGIVPVDEEDIPMTEKPDPNAEVKDASDYEYLLTEYLYRLTSHYNMIEYDDVYYYIKRGSAAYEKIAANKASGNFGGHETFSVELIEMTNLNDGTVKLNANRVYSHDSSEGKRIANVDYIVNAETHEVLDFTQVSDSDY